MFQTAVIAVEAIATAALWLSKKLTLYQLLIKTLHFMIFYICAFFKSSTGTLELVLRESEFLELMLLSVGFFYIIFNFNLVYRSCSSEPRVVWEVRLIKRVLTSHLTWALRCALLLSGSVFGGGRNASNNAVVLISRFYRHVVKAGVWMVYWKLKLFLLSSNSCCT